MPGMAKERNPQAGRKVKLVKGARDKDLAWVGEWTRAWLGDGLSQPSPALP